MRVFAVAVALGIVLAGAPSRAQAPAGQGAPAAPPAQTPQAPAQAAPAPQVKFLEGVKYGFVNLQRAFAESPEGKKVQAFFQTKQAEIEERNKQLQAERQKAQTQASVLSDEKRAALQTELDRKQRDFERLVQDAEEEVQRLQQQAEVDFQRRFVPVIDKIAREKQLHLVFRETGLIWADPGVDLTAEVLAQLGAASAPAPAANTQKPAAPGSPGR